jgi:hypothetical protein
VADRSLAAPLAVIALVVVALFAPLSAMADDDDGGNLSVDIIDDSPSPTPSPSRTTSSSPRPNDPDLPTLPGPSDTPIPTPTATPDPGNGLLLSGLTARALPTLQPFLGAVPVRLTIRNESESVVHGTVVFGLSQPFGESLGRGARAAFTLEPGESTKVSATLTGSGQWPLLHVDAVVTPDDDIDGVDVGSLSRDTWVFNFPWLVLVVLIVLAAAVIVYVVVRRRRGAPE